MWDKPTGDPTLEESWQRPILPIRGAFNTDGMKLFRKLVLDYILLHHGSFVPLSELERIDRAPPATRKRIIRAFYQMCGEVPEAEDYSVKAFIKYQKEKANAVARGIWARSDKALAFMGQYICAVEQPIFKAIDDAFCSPTIMKGYNVEDLAQIIQTKWSKFKNPVAIGLDASRFDQHVSYSALMYEHTFYTPLFHGESRTRLKEALRYQRNTRGKCCGDGFIINFEVPGMRCSGDMNTSLGNCIVMCAMLFDLAGNLNFNIEYLNNGDDCVAIIEQENLHAFTNMIDEFFTNKGFVMKVEPPAYEIEHLEFCQMHPVAVAHGKYTMVRNPRGAVMKDAAMLYNNPKIYRDWLHGVAKGGLSLSAGVPVLQSYYSMLFRNSTVTTKTYGIERTIFAYYGKGLSNPPRPPDTLSRISFQAAYNISVANQLLLERTFDQLTLSSPGEGNISSLYTHILSVLYEC